MRARTRHFALPALAALLCLGVGACDSPDHTAIDCHQGACSVDLESGKSLSVNGQTFYVSEVADDRVKLSLHGISFTLAKGLDLSLAGYRLHLKGTTGGKAAVDLDKPGK